MNIKYLTDDAFGQTICRFFQTAFPKAFKATATQVLEILTAVLVGDKNLRYGPIPAPEQLVVIRQIISDSMAAGIAIPMLVPWGGRKLDKALSLDVAEVSAIKQIICLDETVKKYYPPGLNINVRVEDLNALWLYKELDGIDKYSEGMRILIEMLRADTRIKAVKESDLMMWDDYERVSKRYSELLAPVILARMLYPEKDATTLPEFATLKAAGWQGSIPIEQVSYYIDRYRVMDADKDDAYYAQKLADYFAGSKARYELGGRANPASDIGFIQANFAHPVPNAPKSLFNNTVYYRTVPMSNGKTHIAPWRSKGFLEIDVDNTIKVKVTNWGNKTVIDSLSPARVQFSDKVGEVAIDTDYISRDFEMPFTI